MCLSHVMPKLFWIVFISYLVEPCSSFVLRAYLSQHGLHGEIEFSHKNDTLISIRTNLKPTLQYPDGVWRWTIHEFPVDYRDISESRCSEETLGREIIDLTEELGYLIIPGKDHAEFESKNTLTGPNGLWGRSIVLETAERDRIICASILSTEKLYETHALAKFTAPVAGTLHFRWISAKEIDESDSYIQADLYHAKAVTDKSEYTEHKWKLFVTDIFDSDKGNYEDNCNVLQAVFDPENNGEGMSVGDLDSRLGLIKVATDAKVKKVRTLYKNDVIDILKNDMEMTRRSLYVVIFDNRHVDSFLACAKLRLIPPKSSKVLINMDGIRGTVDFTQRSPFDPTWVNFQLGASDMEYESNLRFVGSMLQYNIRELPPKLLDANQVNYMCNTTGDIYNPMELDLKTLPPPGLSTQDHYPVGDLLGKYKDRTEYLNHKYLLPGLANELSGAYWDVYLPLQGIYSVVHRSLVLERRPGKRNVCGTILLYEDGTEYQIQMSGAQVIFRYPIVGRVIFRQPLDQPWEDTTIIIESMVHADGANVNNTREHRWAIHEHPPGVDYYNWTGRCLSAGKVYEPHSLDIDTRHPEQYCRRGLEGLCRIGDFTTRHGMLSIAGKKVDSDRLTRRLFTDTVISLTGKHSIMRKSLLIYDDHGPVARGERMACSIVNGLHRRKAVVRDWFGNGQQLQLKGKIEMTQQSEYDVTNVQVTIEGLQNVNDYKIHVVPVEKELEFPCEKETLYDTFNPFHVDKSLSPPPAQGTADQYELGDLGLKYGLIDEAKSFKSFYNETQVSLFGPYSILGRSVVLHKKSRDRRWACSSIERGYSPSEAREIRGIASFHHPGGFARGYIRMSQLIHNDGSTSDTVIEVKLRYPGVRDRNYTRNHKWEIFVNPVGVDAAVQVTNTRCVAGGYRWNPYFTQLADPLNHDLYSQECGIDNPLRCDVGDLTARLGTINIGGERQMLMDTNFPLEGKVSAMGRSIVIFGPERTSERFACANIEPDNDIIKYVNLVRTPKFVLGQFLEDIRKVMGVPEWMVSVDSRRTRDLHHSTCIQILLHFTGPHANRLELDFTRLLASGRLDSPSIFIPGYVDTKRKRGTQYRHCGVTDPNEKKRNLEGPFLFFGPKSLEKYKRPALKYLDQDELTKIYGEQAAIVVFNNQDSVPLSSGYFPRLRKMLEGQTVLVLPQDFLDVHPDYISNETQMLTLQGPWSERDAQMTETFARLQDIYGAGRVLGILGNSVSQSQSPDYVEGEWSRVRRQTGNETTTPSGQEEEKMTKAVPKYALYNATGPPGKGALLYSSGWPELRLANGKRVVLSNQVGECTVKPTRLYTMLVVKFADGDSRDKITLEFSFKQSAGWWTAVGVEVIFGSLETSGLNLKAPAPPDAPSAVLGRSYHCSQPLVYTSDEAILRLPDVQMQIFMDSTERFADAFDCIGFTTVPIWSGLMVSFIMLLGLAVSVCMIMDIKTMDRFESNRSKQLTITVNE
ncbi:uncharacterized protein LOC101739289 isoform X1 [Bombyx mori]|uniref:Superoxide dismutase copper/zinc binding domain-containing protein n=1 Tax=Bombyx mori TaxID=7091 RepID=A0A8R2G8Y7_BOMMO|nr:uncharacterized protein LOC101739289 isoform X1 [Bombyx mori]